MTPTSNTTAPPEGRKGKAPKRPRGKSGGRKRAAGGAVAPNQELGSLAGDEPGVEALGGQIPPFAAGSLEIEIPEEPGTKASNGEDTTVSVDPETGTVTIDHEDGSVTVDPTGASLWQRSEEDGDDKHEENLALKIDPMELARIAEDLLDAIAADKGDRAEWERMRAKAVELLGLKLEDPKADVSAGGGGVSTSVVRDPILLEAVERFRANAFAELCPARGPVKVVNWGSETAATDELARSLQKDLNYYLTTTASEYYFDTNHMLWWTGLASGTFKKIYRCPIRRRPVSEYVDGTELIVPSNATDLKNAGRVTHQISMRPSIMKRMQILGVYRDLDLSEPMPAMPGAVETKKAAVEGKVAQPQRPEDRAHTVYECYCELDIRGFEHKEEGKVTGLPLPYRVTIEESSRQILEVRRNWEEDDADLIADIPFVLFPYSMGLSRIYGHGLGQMGGNIAAALTALLRISIDNGMFANFPGFLFSEDLAGGAPGRSTTNHFRVPPGGGKGIPTGGRPIGDVISALPYKDVSQAVVALIEQTRGVGHRLLGTAEVPVGEGRQDAPVGTTLALIEQATKIIAGVHKMLHTAQSEEFRQILKLFRSDPEALWRGNRRPALGMDKAQRLEKFKLALEEYLIVPMADPNVPSEMHRILKAMGLKQLTAGNPAYDQVAVDRRIAQVLQIDDFDTLLAKAPPPIPPQILMALQMQLKELELKVKDLALKEMQALLNAQSKEKDRESRESIEAMKIAATASQAEDGRAAADSQAGLSPVDPVRAADVALKGRKVDLDGVKALLDAQDRRADREARQSEKALDIAARLATHPGSNEIVDEQLVQMAPLLKPQGGGGEAGAGTAAGLPPMSRGGAVEGDGEPDSVTEALDIAQRVAELARAFESPALPPLPGFVPPVMPGGLQ